MSTIGFGTDAATARDVLGQVYEYCLGMFASAEGKRGGQFYTPASIVKTLVAVLAPHHGKVYDPCCGSGGMFVQSEKFIEARGGKIGDVAIFGQEAIPTTWRLAAMNLAIRGIDPGQVLFIDARKQARMTSRVQAELDHAAIERIGATVAAWRGEAVDGAAVGASVGTYEDVVGCCRSVPLAEIAQHGHVLTPGRYVGAEAVADDDEGFAEKMQKLTETLGEQMAKGAELDQLIRQKLGGWGMGSDKPGRIG